MANPNVQHIGINPSKIRMKASRVGSSKNFGVALAGADAMMGVANAASTRRSNSFDRDKTAGSRVLKYVFCALRAFVEPMI